MAQAPLAQTLFQTVLNLLGALIRADHGRDFVLGEGPSSCILLTTLWPIAAVLGDHFQSTTIWDQWRLLLVRVSVH